MLDMGSSGVKFKIKTVDYVISTVGIAISGSANILVTTMLPQLILRNARLSLVRATSRSSRTQFSGTIPSISCSRLQHELPRPHYRGYASKNKVKVKSTSTLVPGSKQPITDPAAQQEYDRADKAMSASVSWFKKECAALETRASGYARPGMISSVRVKIPEQPDMRLEELATIGVREGTTFLVTLYDSQVSRDPIFGASMFVRVLQRLTFSPTSRILNTSNLHCMLLVSQVSFPIDRIAAP